MNRRATVATGAICTALVLVSGVLALANSQRSVTESRAPVSRAWAEESVSQTSVSAGGVAVSSAKERADAGTPDSTRPAVSLPPFTRADMSINITPSCAYRSKKVIVRVQTVPEADVAHGASFADGNHHFIYGLGTSDASGSYLWTFEVPAEAAFGEASVVVVARNHERGEGSGAQTFRVGKPGECA